MMIANSARAFKTYMPVLIPFLLFMAAPLAQAQSPLFLEEFEGESFEQLAWTAIPNEDFQRADVSLGLLPVNPENPDATNGRGLVLTASRGQGALIFGPVINTDAQAVVLRLSVLALAPGASVALGALDVPPGGSIANTDNSGVFLFENDSGFAQEQYQTMITVVRPKSGAIIPVFQLALNENADTQVVTAFFDRYEVFPLTAETVLDPALQNVFDIEGEPVAPTPTPTLAPTATPTLPPEATPTPTPTLPAVTPTPQPDLGINYFIELSPLSDQEEAFEPDIAYESDQTYLTVAADNTLGFQDVLLREINNEEVTITEPFIVNDPKQDTVTRNPSIELDPNRVRHVAWADNRRVDKFFGVYLTAVDAFNQRIVTDDFLVNLPFEETDALNPSFALQESGELVVVWQDNRNFVTDIYTRRLQWTGGSYEALDENDFIVNRTFENTNAANPDVAMDGEGQIVAVWNDNRFMVEETKRDDIYARFFSLDTVPNEIPQVPESELEVMVSLDDELLDQSTQPRIAYSNGYYLVVWQSLLPATGNQAILGTVLNRAGEVLQQEFIIDSGEEANRAGAPDVIAWSPNRFVVTWADASANTLHLRFYDAAENSFLTTPVELLQEVVEVSQMRIAAGEDNQALLVWEETLEGLREVSGLSLGVNSDVLLQQSLPVAQRGPQSGPDVAPLGLAPVRQAQPRPMADDSRNRVREPAGEIEASPPRALAE